MWSGSRIGDRKEQDMLGLIVSMIDQYGYWGILFLITVENIFPPIPSEVILTFGGFLTTCTDMEMTGVIIFSTLGSLLGAVILYLVGKILHKDRLIRLTSGKIGRILRLKAQDIQAASDWFDKKGYQTVFFCRFIPIVRSLISIPAGMNGMKIGSFFLYTLAGSVVWNAVLITLGRLVGESWGKVAALLGRYSDITLIVLVIAGISAMIYFYRRHRPEAVP